MATAITRANTGFHMPSIVAKMIDRARVSRARRAVYNKSLTELQNMSNDELVEFGLYRTDLHALAQEEARRVVR